MDKYLIVAHGLPGTGKSTYTQNLQTSICSEIFSMTKTRRELGYKRYSKKSTPKVVSTTLNNVGENLEKRNTILESNFIKKDTREYLYEIFGDNHIIMIEFKCSGETSKKRMKNRKKNDGLTVDSRNPKRYDELTKVYETVDFGEIEENQSVIFTQFNSEKGEFDIINREKLTDEALEFMENIKDNLLETFNNINNKSAK